MAKKKTASSPNEQAELILHLFELRREAVMREARSYIGGAFRPRSAEEFVRAVTAGDRQSSFVLQVYGYWEMVAAFVTHGALSPELVYDTCQELYFQFAKIEPYLAEFRKQMASPEWLIGVERLVNHSPAGRRRMAQMRKSLESMDKRKAEKPA